MLRTSAITLDLERTKVVGVKHEEAEAAAGPPLPRAGQGRRLPPRKLRVRVQASSNSGRNQEDELGRLKILRARGAG